MIDNLLKSVVACVGVCLMSHPVNAEEVFWSFTDDQTPLPIPAECDAYFDEVRGGAFVPSTEEVYQSAMNFLKSDIESVKRQAPYCLLVAALDGHNQAQLELARMYNEGKYLPQDDLSAYKWSFIAALDGNKNAERFALTLEQFLTNDDLSQTTAAIMETRTKVESAKKARQLAEQEALKEKQQALESSGAQGVPAGRVAPNSLEPIFNEEDRAK
ncbi:MAG: sel1 repeat family protein [Alphaproteobacteria bacterium]|nr:sel1 repeat family protein [Alphaproteobacteria bacterium]